MKHVGTIISVTVMPVRNVLLVALDDLEDLTVAGLKDIIMN